MPHEKTIGKPDAGNPHVRFEKGSQESKLVGLSMTKMQQRSHESMA